MVVNHLNFKSLDEVLENYSYYLYKSLKIRARIKRVSLDNYKLIAHSSYGDVLINIPKMYYSKLKEVKKIQGPDLIHIHVIVEGIPFYSRYFRKVGIKQAKVLEIIGY